MLSQDGMTALHWAAREGHEGVVRSLTAKRGVDVAHRDTVGGRRRPQYSQSCSVFTVVTAVQD